MARAEVGDDLRGSNCASGYATAKADPTKLRSVQLLLLCGAGSPLGRATRRRFQCHRPTGWGTTTWTCPPDTVPPTDHRESPLGSLGNCRRHLGRLEPWRLVLVSHIPAGSCSDRQHRNLHFGPNRVLPGGFDVMSRDRAVALPEADDLAKHSPQRSVCAVLPPRGEHVHARSGIAELYEHQVRIGDIVRY